MIVIDASAVIELLLDTAAGRRVETRIQAVGESLHAPHLVDLEIVQVLRRFCSTGVMTPRRANEAIEDFQDLRIRRHGHLYLMDRIWSLRHNLTAYDACYVALAEDLSAVLLTGDAGIASAHFHSAKVELV